MIAGLYNIFDHWSETGTVWMYSDPHFGDKELAAGQVNRPDDETQIKMINSKVGRKDTLIILGDVGNIECVQKLRGYKVLICGNHDIGHTSYKRIIEKRIFDKDKYTREQALAEMKSLFPNCKYSIDEGYDVCHSPFEFWVIQADNQLFNEVYTGPLMIGEKVILSHEPIPNLGWAVNLHGHVHTGSHKRDTNHFNFCAEAIGFIPVNMNQWFKQGYLSKSESLHRATIDSATKRAKKRGYKMGRK